MRHLMLNHAMAGVGAVLVLFAPQLLVAAPVPTGSAALKAAMASDVTEVDWRNRRWRDYDEGFGYGRLGPDYEPPHYYYGPPPAYYVDRPSGSYYRHYQTRRYYHRHRDYSFSQSYPFEPYPDPFGPLRQCWVLTDKDRGYGYFQPC